jgi:hypothetical protein
VGTVVVAWVGAWVGGVTPAQAANSIAIAAPTAIAAQRLRIVGVLILLSPH